MPATRSATRQNPGNTAVPQVGIPRVVTPPARNPPPPAFALTPAQSVRGTIDMSGAEGRKLYNDAIKPVCNPVYDLEAGGLHMFMAAVTRRANNYGWTLTGGIMNISEIANDPISLTNNLLEAYGQITLEQVRDYDKLYMLNPERRAQDNMQLYECLMNSLSNEANHIMALRNEDFQVQGRSSGTLLLKAITAESRIDTFATSNMVRTKLGRLSEHILTIEDNNIIVFNRHVKSLVEILQSRKEKSDDLMTNLFNAYINVKDKEFVRFMMDKQARFEEGTANYDVNQIMNSAANRYKILKERELWNKASAEEEMIGIMETKVENLSKQLREATKSKKGSPHKTITGQVDKNGDRVIGLWFIDSRQPYFKKRYDSRKYQGKEVWWCGTSTEGTCNAWGHHKSSECPNSKGTTQSSTLKNPSANKEGIKRKQSGVGDRKTKFAKALTSQIVGNNESDESENSDESN